MTARRDRLDEQQAARVGEVSPLTWTRYVRNGTVPPPDGIEDGRSWWHRSTVEKWRSNRPRKGATGGRPKTDPNDLPSLARRFWPKVDVRAPGDCWEWTAYRDPNGYGRMSAGQGQVVLAHRLSYRLHHGDLEDGMGVLHRCDNPPCVNPTHLFAGTQSDNMQDCSAKGRTTRCDVLCRAGLHLMTEENSKYKVGSTGRECRECLRASTRERARRKREAEGKKLRPGRRATTEARAATRVHSQPEVPDGPDA